MLQKNYAKNKVEHIMANYSGKILGFLAAESAEQLICQGTQLGFLYQKRKCSIWHANSF